MHRIIFTTILILLITNISFSQGDFKTAFIVNLKYDTIYGIGDISKNQEYCLFKKFDEKDYTKYMANQMIAFRVVGGKYYLSREILKNNRKSKWYFLEYLVDGEIDLYTISHSGRYFIKKEDEAFLELNDNIKEIKKIDGKQYMVHDTKYLGFLKIYMSDVPELFPQINKMGQLNQRDLVNLSMDYHNAVCNDSECINYTKKIPKITYKIEVFSGLTYHNKYYSPQFGVLLHIWRPLKNEKLYVKTGLLFSDKPYIYKYIMYLDANEDERDYAINIPISFQYVFGEKQFKPTIAFGFPTGINRMIFSFQGGFIYSLSKNIDLSFSSSIDGLLAFPMNMHKDIFNNNFGHSINLGLIYQIK